MFDRILVKLGQFTAVVMFSARRTVSSGLCGSIMCSFALRAEGVEYVWPVAGIGLKLR